MTTRAQLLPADRYEILVHGLVRSGPVVRLHASTLPEGDRFAVRVFNHHVVQLLKATLNQRTGDDLSGVQVIVELGILPEYEINNVIRILPAERIIDVKSDVVIRKPVVEHVAFGDPE